MIGRRTPRKSEEKEIVKPKGFDDFDLRLGDMMRGERATMGKSLLDVQRELRIKASYIAAIENSDPSAFDTPGFIAGYVRSYARYLGMNPDDAFTVFCEESGFSVAHGMSAEASVVKKSKKREKSVGLVSERDPFTAPNTPFAPVGDGLFSQIEPRAIGSTLVLLGLIVGIGYGGWSVLKEVQQVQFAPVDQAPLVLSDLDPLERAAGQTSAGLQAPTAEALDRLYRPPALDLPVLVARDAPISTLDPRTVGTFTAPVIPQAPRVVQAPQAPDDLGLAVDQIVASVVPQVFEDLKPQLSFVAVRTSWVRVQAVDGSVIYEGTMERGDTYAVPALEEPPTLRTGESGAIYFTLDGEEHFGPVGRSGTVTSNLPLSIATVMERFEVADLNRDRDLARMVAEAQTTQPLQP
ncbi:MAG: helix-turn-helix domain-containing protein [Sedimentitalea sp.]